MPSPMLAAEEEANLAVPDVTWFAGRLVRVEVAVSRLLAVR